MATGTSIANNMPTHLDEICYKKNFLTEVIARADFVSPFPDLDKKLPTELTEIALKRFPIYEPQQGVEREIQFKMELGPDFHERADFHRVGIPRQGTKENA